MNLNLSFINHIKAFHGFLFLDILLPFREKIKKNYFLRKISKHHSKIHGGVNSDEWDEQSMFILTLERDISIALIFIKRVFRVTRLNWVGSLSLLVMALRK